MTRERAPRPRVRHTARKTVVAMAIDACLASAACGIAPATAGRDSSTLVIDTTNYPSTLDPGQQYDTDSYSVYRNIFDQLLRRDPKTNAIKPWIATSWAQSDPKTWKFAIRPGVTFSDGTPLTAAHAAFSINRILDKSFGSQQYANFSVISKASVEGGDLIVQTSVPSPTLLSYLATLSVVPEAYVKKVGDKTFAVKPIGSGPYVLASATAGSQIRADQESSAWVWEADQFVAEPAGVRLRHESAGRPLRPRDREAARRRSGSARRTAVMATSPSFNPQIVQAIQADLAAVGLKVEIQNTDQATYLKKVQSPSHDWGAVRFGRWSCSCLDVELPSPLSRHSGCAFSSRCPLATDRCHQETPVLRTLSQGQSAACHYAETAQVGAA